MEDASSPRRIVPSIAASASAPDHRFSVNGLDSRTREEAQQPQQLEVETRRGMLLSSPLLAVDIVLLMNIRAELKDSN